MRRLKSKPGDAMDQSNIPPRLQEIIEDFQLSEGREKLNLLLDYSENLRPLPAWLKEDHNQMDQVEECMSPVYVYGEVQDGKMKFYVDAPPQSPTVRGYAALLAEGLDGATPEQVLQVPGDFYIQMGLHQVLSQQRLNGIAAILAHMKQLALQKMHP